MWTFFRWMHDWIVKLFFLISGVWNARPNILQRRSIFCNWFTKRTWHLGYRVSSICSCIQLYYYMKDKNNFCSALCSNEGRRYRTSPNFPTRFHPSDVIEFGSDKVKISSVICLTRNFGISIILLKPVFSSCAGSISCKGNEISSKNYWKEGRAWSCGGSVKLDLI